MSINNRNGCQVIQLREQESYTKEVYAVLDSLKLKLENVLDPQWDVVFYEALSRFDERFWNICEIINFLKENDATYLWLQTVLHVLNEENINNSEVSINVFPSDLSQRNFVKDLCDRTKKIPTNHIVLEILEEDFDDKQLWRAMANLRAAKELGFKVAIDDILPGPLYEKYSIPYNSGAANLDKLSEAWIVPDIIKIDGKIIRTILDEKIVYDLELLSFIWEWKNAWVNEIVAEWVQSVEEARFLEKHYGISMYQWYKIHPEDFKKSK